MRTHLMAPTLLAVMLSGVFAMPAAAQTTGPVQFDETESALTGTVACNGGAATPIASVVASTTDISGSNDNNASNVSGTACGLPLYSIGSADDSTSAQDTPSQDDAMGNSVVNTVSLLGGVLKYDAKNEADYCAVAGQAVNCQDTTTIQNLVFGGQRITGQFSQATIFNAVNLSVQVPGFCTGLALFTGTLTVAGTSTNTQNGSATVNIAPIALKGTLTCVGLPLASMQVDVQDYSYYDISGLPAAATISSVDTAVFTK